MIGWLAVAALGAPVDADVACAEGDPEACRVLGLQIVSGRRRVAAPEDSAWAVWSLACDGGVGCDALSALAHPAASACLRGDTTRCVEAGGPLLSALAERGCRAGDPAGCGRVSQDVTGPDDPRLVLLEARCDTDPRICRSLGWAWSRVGREHEADRAFARACERGDGEACRDLTGRVRSRRAWERWDALATTRGASSYPPRSAGGGGGGDLGLAEVNLHLAGELDEPAVRAVGADLGFTFLEDGIALRLGTALGGGTGFEYRAFAALGTGLRPSGGLALTGDVGLELDGLTGSVGPALAAPLTARVVVLPSRRLAVAASAGVGWTLVGSADRRVLGAGVPGVHESRAGLDLWIGDQDQGGLSQNLHLGFSVRQRGEDLGGGLSIGVGGVER